MKKKLLFLVTFIALIANIGAQTLVSTDTQKKNVVLEEYTGIHCVYCPQGHAIAQALKDENPGDVVLINIHQGSFAVPSGSEPDFRTEFGDAIANQANLTGYPSGSVNRHFFPDLASAGGTAMGRGSWTTAAGITFMEDSPVNVGASSSYNESTRELTINVELYYTSDSPESSNFINVAVLQSNILGPQTGGNAGNNYVHNHMLRYLITGQWGEEITTTAQGTFVERTYTYTVPENYNDVDCIVEDCKIAVFVTETHQEIYSGVEVPAIDGTTLIAASIAPPSELVIVGQTNETSVFDLSITNLLPATDNFILTLTKNDEPESWNSTFSIDGNTYEETATVNLEAGVQTDFSIMVTPSDITGIVKYTFLAQSESYVNAPTIFINVYLMSNVDNLLVNNQGAWTGGSPADFQQDYFDGFDYADMINYTACDYKTFRTLGDENKLMAIPNLYFNIGWTFPSFTDENVGFLASFLDNGGNLFVAGQDIGWDTWDAAGNGTDITKDFYTNYLFADYKSDGGTSNNSVYPYSNEEIFGTMADFSIVDIYGGNMYPDEISPLGDAISIFKYNDNDSKSAAVRYANDVYKIVYLGFDPSMGSTESMNEIVRRTNDWFNFGVGVNEIFESLIKVFPNPASNNVTVESASIIKHISIYDISGRKVYSVSLNQNKVELNIESFDKGIYMIQLETDSGTITEKLSIF
ncbi:MAG: Omp28-related outer membrane protein [Bacteroidota bacterium]